MNIILNREINGYRLPDSVKVAAAMNPSSKYEQYSGSDYQVVDLDPAQEDRFVWIEMEADVKAWIAWGMEEGQLEEDILSFISSYPEYLHTPHSNEMVKATPRSWERVSKAYRVYLHRKSELPQRIFLNVVKGNVGASIAQEFFSFIESNKLTLIKPEEVFDQEDVGQELIARIKKESPSRLYMTARGLLRYLKNSEAKQQGIKLFSEFLQHYPQDLKLAVMREIREDYFEELYQEFLQQSSFIEGFFQIYKDLD